jgi:myo-inositol-hexaphosphate 3-phosphohydrolase
VILNNGGRIAFYPYVYVVIQNASSSSSDNRFIIYSNNPNTYQAIFKVPVTDMNQPLISPFVRLNGNGMTQTLKFKQTDDMNVSVLLPNGELFQTSQEDTKNGQAPNPLLQISFCFSMNPV